MAERLWEDRLTGLALAEDEIGKDHSLELLAHDEPVALLSTETARALASALVKWAGRGSTAKASSRLGAGYGELPGATFEVYYVHEVTGDGGEVIPCPALGPDLDEGRYTWEERSLAGVQDRLKWLDEQLSDLEKKHKGTFSGGESDAFRPWVSIFRMPEDTRVWKGFADEFDSAAAEDCLADID